ncbi:MAG: hypothetical protein ABIV50_11485, partial [Opitutus sp.]
MSVVVIAGRAWAIAAAVGVIAIFAVLALFRTPDMALSRAPAHRSLPAAQVELAPLGDSLLNEEVALRDPTPLFLPTRWNAVEDALAMTEVREPGGSFRSYPPSLTFPEAQLKLDLAPSANIPPKAADAFSMNKPDRPYAGFGQSDRKVAPLPIRGGFVEVANADSGQIVLQHAVLEDRPPAEGTWEPLEFLIAVDATGIIRPPVLTESSRVPAVDVFF